MKKSSLRRHSEQRQSQRETPKLGGALSNYGTLSSPKLKSKIDFLARDLRHYSTSRSSRKPSSTIKPYKKPQKTDLSLSQSQIFRKEDSVECSKDKQVLQKMVQALKTVNFHHGDTFDIGKRPWDSNQNEFQQQPSINDPIEALNELHKAFELIYSLDQQLTRAKLIIARYKDLAIKLQLQVNYTEYKASRLLKQNEALLKNQSERIGKILNDVSAFTFQPSLDSKQVLASLTQMPTDHQRLFETLLISLHKEQSMRLASEEQHEKILIQSHHTQKQLETQLRMLKDRLQSFTQTTQENTV